MGCKLLTYMQPGNGSSYEYALVDAVSAQVFTMCEQDRKCSDLGHMNICTIVQ